MENWLTYSSSPEELVISNRIRIARNIKSKPFPHKLSIEEARKVVKEVEQSFFTTSYINNNYKSVRLWEQSPLEANRFVERHLISNELVNNREGSAFIFGENETVSLMVNEEDHIRLQCMGGGFNLRESFDMANKLDDLIEENLQYAFDDKMGYITACPTNLGTGMRASIMIHLPALTMNNEMNGILKVLTQVGMTIRGLYGEGSKAQGNIYQISNQITLGLSEEDIISNLEAVVNQIIAQERATRERLYAYYKYELEDKIFRSIGILKNAVMLNLNESLDLLSNVRMGVEMDIIKDIDKSMLNDLLIRIHPASLQKEYNANFNEKESNINRARMIRDALGN
ncbi:protein arginine kinase [Clostridium thermarum]|uniref:protein arginine kinase n=1 Tax=Clostridium thermarum TaxID=1716543 RepID=UPI0011235D67|nr:protein arginine kinase [Clostridium thermarum]